MDAALPSGDASRAEVGAGDSAGDGAARGVLQLPVEVLGYQGAERTVSLELDAASLAGAQPRLWLQVHALTYEDKGSVSVNGGAPVPFRNDTVEVLGALARGAGGIGGGFATLRLAVTLPAGALRVGTNTLTFRFTPRATVPSPAGPVEGGSIGYRVVRLNLQRADGTMVLPPERFVDDDPSRWTAPDVGMPAPAAAALGGRLWNGIAEDGSRVVLTNPSTLAGPRTFSVHCGDCHARDGRDLRYFNYSNLSIIERSRLHGLTERQGQLIAAYLRTLPDVPYAPRGRPWNPPYQPGPGLDALPASQWAAGAGVDAVLERDLDLVDHLFPGVHTGPGSTAADYNLAAITPAAVARPRNARETPVELQLPDWNHWLPPIHPRDIAGEILPPGDPLFGMYDGDNGAYTARVPLRQVLRIHDAASLRAIRDYWVEWMLARYDALNRESPGYADTLLRSLRRRSIAHWFLTKAWELHQEFQMEDLAGAIEGPMPEPRSWMRGRYLFDTSPNLTHIAADVLGINANQGQSSFLYFSLGWYHLQLMLFSGNGNTANINGQSPVDWGYMYGHFAGAPSTFHTPMVMMQLLYIYKAIDITNTGLGPDHYNSGGWDPVAMNPATLFDFGTGEVGNWADTPTALRSALLEATLTYWIQRNESYPRGAYYAGDNLASWGLAAGATGCPEGGNFGFQPLVASMYAARSAGFQPQNLAAYGVSLALQRRIATWAQSLWPQFDWHFVCIGASERYPTGL